jgi:hypothetical protein
MKQKTYKTYKKDLIDSIKLINNYKINLFKAYQENISNLKLQKQENINLEIINKEIYFIIDESINKHLKLHYKN